MEQARETFRLIEPAGSQVAPMPGMVARQWPMTGIQTQAQLQSLLQMIEYGMPAVEVVHSLHMQALTDASLTDLPAMRRFSDAGLDNLHNMVAAAGSVRRMLSGDTSEAVARGLRQQLKAIGDTHQEASSAFAALMGAPAAQQNPAVQSLSQVLGVVDQQVRTMAPLVSLLIAEAPTVVQPESHPASSR